MSHKIRAKNWLMKIDLDVHSSSKGRRGGIGSAVPESCLVGIDEAVNLLAVALLKSDGARGVIDAGDGACHGGAAWLNGGSCDGQMPCGEKDEECETKGFHEDDGLRMCGRWWGVFLP